MSEITHNIIQRCKRGNRVAQKQLYSLSKDRVKRIAIRYCPTIEDAKDTVQESYLKIFRSIESFDPKKGNFQAWSTRIVVNEAYAVLRKKRKVDVVDIEDAPSLSIDEKSVSQLTLSEVKETIDKLKADHKLVINMHFFEEYSYKEMAQILEIKESSVRSKVTRAKAELKSFWSERNKINYEFK